MTVDTFVQILVGAFVVTIGSYLMQGKNIQDDETSIILPIVFFISGWVIIVVGMKFDPFALLAAVLMILSLFVRGTDLHEMSFLFATIGGVSFARAVLGSSESVLSMAAVILATVAMGVYWIMDAPITVSAVSWVLFALVAARQS